MINEKQDTMKTRIGYLSLLLSMSISMTAITGCTSDKTEMEKTGRLQYEPETNMVDVIRLEKGPFFRQLTANGKLQAHKKTAMYFDSQDIIVDIRAENGMSVDAGDTLALQDVSDELLELEAAEIALAKAELEYMDVLAGQGFGLADTASAPGHVKELAEIRSGYSAAMNSLHQAERAVENAVLRAPFRGKVADIEMQIYDKSPSGAFCTLIDDSMFDVDFTVLESEYRFLKKGLSVTVKPFFGEPHVLTGVITGINPRIDENGQVAVRASVRNDGTLVDGMNVKVVVENRVEDMLVVPKSAVLIRDNLEVIFRYSKGRAQWTYVDVLMSNGDSHAVTANTDRDADLSAGDTVIVSGNLNLADGSEVVLRNDTDRNGQPQINSSN